MYSKYKLKKHEVVVYTLVMFAIYIITAQMVVINFTVR